MNNKNNKIIRSVKATFSWLLLTASLSLITLSPVALSSTELSSSEFSAMSFTDVKSTLKATERYLLTHHPELMRDPHLNQVLSFYYFGSFQGFTIIGMERVKGDDYHQHNTLLIFKDSVLQGYYEELSAFPASINEQGIIEFPANSNVVDKINLGQNYYPAIIFSRDKQLNPATHNVSDFLLIKSQTGEHK
jgi:hypothetical protein